MAPVRIDRALRVRLRPVWCLVALALGGSLMYGQPPSVPQQAVPPQQAQEEQVVEVRILGHKRVPAEKIIPHIRTRAGRVFRPETVEDDVRRLNATRMFVNVRPFIQQVAGGRLVIYEVIERPVLEHVKYVGNQQIAKKTLGKESGIKSGDPMDPFAVEEGRRRLESFYQSKGFAKVQITIVEGNKAGDRGAIYLIDEGPKQRILRTKFEGNTVASDARLTTLIQSKPGILWIFKGTIDRKQLDEDGNRLVAYYRGLGFFQARVGHPLLDFNENQDWATVTFVIDEGPRYQVRNVSVIGNTKFANEELLRDLKLKSGRYFNQAEMTTDVLAMQDIYGGVGYIFADVRPDPRFLEEPGKLDLVYAITEGGRYRVGRVDVEIKGPYPHTRISTVLNRISLQPGDIVDIRELRASERRLKASGLFKVDPANGVVPKIVFTPPDQEKSGEGIARRPKAPSGFRGQSPDPAPRSAFRPPIPDDPSDRVIDVTLEGESAYPENPQPWTEAGPQDRPTPQSRDSHCVPMIVRGQSPDDEAPAQSSDGRTQPPLEPVDRSAAASTGLKWRDPRRPVNYEPAAAALPNAAQSAGPAAPGYAPQGILRPPAIVRGQYTADAGWSTPPLGPTSPAAPTSPWANGRPAPNGSGYQQPAAPNYTRAGLAPASQGSLRATASQGNGWYPNGNSPEPIPPGPVVGPADPGPALGPAASGALSAPYGGASPRSLPLGPTFDNGAPVFGSPPAEDLPLYIPLNPIVEETETGRLMFSVGINSEAGLIGSIVLDEQNFDWTRCPRSWEDVRNRSAWRGAGQRFRAEAMPGTEVQRYAVTFQEPYLFDTKVSLSLSGFFYDRIFREWTEERIGGRVALGYQFTHDLSGTLAFRGAKVYLSNPVTYGVPELDKALGTSALYGFQGALAHDTRDNAFLATEGHLVEMSFEQVIGTYQYPRGEIDLRQYFLLRQHPDGSGRHVLSVSGRAAITGDDTPIYENYFAGGFSTIRGFRYRGASPVQYDAFGTPVTVGGKFMLLGSVEYLFPITADDTLRGVVFCDTGTVLPKMDDWSDKYRISPGFGLRITIPAMGPAPIALDFAFPVSHQPGDRLEAFSFWIGFLR